MTKHRHHRHRKTHHKKRSRSHHKQSHEDQSKTITTTTTTIEEHIEHHKTDTEVKGEKVRRHSKKSKDKDEQSQSQGQSPQEKPLEQTKVEPEVPSTTATETTDVTTTDDTTTGTTTTAVSYEVPETTTATLPPSNSDCLQDFFIKVWILLWKCFLQRRRSWFLWICEIVFTLLLGGLILILPPISMIGGGATTSPGLPPSLSAYHKLLGEIPKKQLYYAPNVAVTKGIIMKVMEKSDDGVEFIGMKSEGDVDAHFNKISLDETKLEKFGGAIIFEKYTKNEFKYKIRFPPENSTNLSNLTLPPTSKLFSSEDGPSSEYGTWHGKVHPVFISNYESRGVLGLQIAVDESAALQLTSKKLIGEVDLKVFPYPDLDKVQTLGLIGGVMSAVILFVFIFPNAFLTKNVVGEKETGVKELMKLSGYPGWLQWLAWYSVAVAGGILCYGIFLLLWFLVPTMFVDKPLLIKSDPTLWLFILTLAVIANASFVFFVCGIIRSSALANGMICVYTIFTVIFCPLVVITNFFTPDFDADILLLLSLMPQTCTTVALVFLCAFEGLGGGARWGRVAEELPGFPDLTLGHTIWMFLMDTMLYMLVGTYIESILPSEYGVSKPWYYPVSPILDLIKNRDLVAVEPVVLEESKTAGFEKRHVYSPAGVIVRNIVKKFGPKVAVNNVSLTMYDGEIFVLLGHNGAGKTTLISILSGLISPTRGTAIVYGNDLNRDIDKIRKSLGLCPQHDMLFKNLTVMEHLKIFGAMKGKSLKNVNQEAQSLLQMMQLSDKVNTFSNQLSGGQKRKLCLGMALIGGAKVVIIDECSSGMDPEARRVIWDVLLKLRGSRTILLTTHFMEEADALGDNIAIMAEGKIQCSGTPAFLKSFYGSGFTLKVSLFPGGDRKAVLQAIQKHIPDASMKSVKMMADEIFITLPTQSATSSALSAMFGTLTDKKKELSIENVGLSMSTIDEVFVKVGELASGHQEAPFPKLLQSQDAATTAIADPERPENDPYGNAQFKPERSIFTKMSMQILAIFLKRIFYARRRPWFTIFMFIFPSLLMMYLSYEISYDIIAPKDAPSALEMEFKTYSKPVTIYAASYKNLTKRIEKAIGSESTLEYVESNVKGALITAAKKHQSFKRLYVVAAEMNKERFTAWYNKFVLHAAPLAINLASNARAPPNFRITISIHPLQTEESLIIEAANQVKYKGLPITTRMIGVFSLVLPSMTACFLVLPIRERLNQSKQLQLMTGINPFIYWIITFIWDIVIWTVIAALMILFIFIFEKYRIFSSYRGLGAIFMMIECLGIFAIPFAYLISRLPKTVSGGILIVFLILFLPVIGELFIVGSAPGKVMIPLVGAYLRVFPYSGMLSCLFKIANASAFNAKCNYFTDKVTNLICKNSTGNASIYDDLKSCCEDCENLVGVKCFKPAPHLTWQMDYWLAFLSPAEPPPSNIIVPGVWQLLVCFCAVGLFIFLFHILIDLGVFRMIRKQMLKAPESDFSNDVEDDDVLRENERVLDLIGTGRKADDAFIVDNLCKSFGSFSAVSKLRFGVHHGECFGLLGTNGAGKTTTFRIITGDEIQSFGDCYEGLIFLSSDRSTFLANIGYCPQFDAFVPPFSGKENLLMFALLRGLSFSEANSEVQKWLEKVGLEKDGPLPAKNYSGGMKRRLSAAMAMIADPPIILLDEPTSGVDPISRRQFWKILESVKASKNQAIILTSHSMDECEVLCSRLGIMVNGQLQCLGGVQHLKHKFAQGYTLTLTLKTPALGDVEETAKAAGMLEALNGEITKRFAPCTLKEQHETVLKYEISNTEIGWNVLYNSLEDLKKSFKSIVEDYSVNETTLEEVFLSFAQKQYGPRESKTPILKRILTCQC